MATKSLQFQPYEAEFLATNFPALFKVNGTAIPIRGLSFAEAPAANQHAFFDFSSANYGSGDVTVKIRWYADTATSGVVRWGVALAAITPNTDTQDIETKALATAIEGNTTHLGTTGQREHESSLTITGASLDSLAAGDSCWIDIYRDTADAADTMTGVVIITKVILEYSDT